MAQIRNLPADINALESGDWIAFAWRYSSPDPFEIMVAQISYCSEDKKNFCVSFLWGHKSVAEDVKAEDIIAIGTSDGPDRIKLYRGGNFHILKPDDEVLKNWQERFKDR